MQNAMSLDSGGIAANRRKAEAADTEKQEYYSMIIIWGTRASKKILGDTAVYSCNNCNNANPHQIVRVMKWFTLFWIPIFPFSIKHFITCPICSHDVQINKDQAAAELAKTSAPQNQ